MRNLGIGVGSLLVVLGVGGIVVSHMPVQAKQQVQPAPVVDEAKELVAACGAPLHDSQHLSPAISPGAVQRTLSYKSVEFQFLTVDGGRGWTMTGAFAPRRDDALAESEAAKRMPCIDRVDFSNDLFQR